MSAPAVHTAEKGSAYLEHLKQAAEAQMRRPAPPLPAPKKQKQNNLQNPAATAAADTSDAGHASDGEGGGEAAAAERVGRYSYAAADAVVAGCSGFIGMCDFKRSSSATKEMLDILKAVLPGGAKLQLVKVGCRGLVVIMLQQQQQQQQEDDDAPQQLAEQQQQQQQQHHNHHQEGEQQLQDVDAPQQLAEQQQQQQQQGMQAEAQPAAVVAELLARMEAGSIQRPRFCQRIAPVETTCAMAASALEAAVKKVVSSYIAAHYSSSSASSIDQQQKQQRQQQEPVQFAVLFKNRDSTAPQQSAQAAQSNQQQKQQASSNGSTPQQQQPQQPPAACERLDKSRAINIAVAAVHECCTDFGGAKVNLSQPQVAVMLEVLPLVGQQACAVSALPGSLMVFRRKLCVKPTAKCS